MTDLDRKYLEDRTREQNAAFKSAWRAAATPKQDWSIWPFALVVAIGLLIWWGWTGP